MIRTMSGVECSESANVQEVSQWLRDGTWPSDNELHLLIDLDRSPVFIHVSGTLDARTGANLDPVIQEVIGEGHLQFDLDMDGLDVADPVGFATLSAVQHSIVAAGGTLTRCQDVPRARAEAPAFPFLHPVHKAEHSPRREARILSASSPRA